MTVDPNQGERYMNAYAIERSNGTILMTLFNSKQDAMAHAENLFEPDSDLPWNKVRQKYNLKIIKVVLRIEKW